MNLVRRRSGREQDGIPYRYLMGMSAAALHWSADAFWSATPHELYAAFEAYEELNSSGDH